MRIKIILASICSMLISCATLTGGDSGQKEITLETVEESSPSLDMGAAPAGSADPSYASHEMTDSQAPMEIQAAEQQSAQVDTMNEQRSTSELDAAAPAMEPVLSAAPSEAPQEPVASWDQHSENLTPASPSYEDEKPLPLKKSKAISKSKKLDKKKIAKSKKQDKKKIAKQAKKSKKAIAKHGKKSKKAIAKKSKAECKKIVKNAKKHSKREIAMCKAETKKKVAAKSGKTGKLAQAGCNCNYR